MTYGRVPLPLTHRSVVIHMERTRTKPERRLDAGDTSDIETIYSLVWQWAHSKPKLDLDPELPESLRNRQADNWRPLIAIADSFGPAWGELAREAAIAFTRGHHDEDPGVVLLQDIRDHFDEAGKDRLPSAATVARLLDLEDRPWSEWRGIKDDQQPRRFNQSQLAQLLAPFHIRPRVLWPLRRKTDGGKSARGYHRQQFERAWQAYLGRNRHTVTSRAQSQNPHVRTVTTR